jgi:fructokinase
VTGDSFAGLLPFYGACLEGLASGEAMWRWGRPVGVEPEAEYLAHVVVNLTYAPPPERITMGGGADKRTSLLPPVRTRVLGLAACPATAAPTAPAAMDGYLVGPELGGQSGITGAVEPARMARPDRRGTDVVVGTPQTAHGG